MIPSSTLAKQTTTNDDHTKEVTARGHDPLQDAVLGETPSARHDQGANLSWLPRFPLKLRWVRGLSRKLMLMCLVFVLGVEFLILVPSLAALQERWLLDRVRQAEIASLALDAAPNSRVTGRLANQLLKGAGVQVVSIQVDGVRHLVLAAPRAIDTPDYVNLIDANPLERYVAPWVTLFAPEGRLIRAAAPPRVKVCDFVEIVVPSDPLKAELVDQLLQLVGVAALVAVAAGLILYASLRAFIVRPMRRLTHAIEQFREQPEAIPAAAAAIRLKPRDDEIGAIEVELSRMQGEVRQALRSRARLAALGQVVAKISHDLRNMLTSAQMASDRLADSGDPVVALALPRLEKALSRAIHLSESVLAYGKAEEPAPQRQTFCLLEALRGAADDAGLGPDEAGGAAKVRLLIDLPDRFDLTADPDQVHRILVNLLRNAREALEAAGLFEPRRAWDIRVRAHHLPVSETGPEVRIEIADRGPGLPQKARDNLFQPFAGGVRKGGTGLGLTIARELAQGHGGDLVLLETSAQGTRFEIRLPDLGADGATRQGLS